MGKGLIGRRLHFSIFCWRHCFSTQSVVHMGSKKKTVARSVDLLPSSWLSENCSCSRPRKIPPSYPYPMHQPCEKMYQAHVQVARVKACCSSLSEYINLSVRFCVLIVCLLSGRCLEAEEKHRITLEYCQQLLLSALLSLCDHLSGEGVESARGECVCVAILNSHFNAHSDIRIPAHTHSHTHTHTHTCTHTCTHTHTHTHTHTCTHTLTHTHTHTQHCCWKASSM